MKNRTEDSSRRLEHLELALAFVTALVAGVWFLAWLISGVSAKTEVNSEALGHVQRLSEETFATVIELREDNAVLKEKMNQLERRYAPEERKAGTIQADATIRGDDEHAFNRYPVNL